MCVFVYVSELNVASCVVAKRVSVVFAKGFDQFHDILIIVKWPQDASVSFYLLFSLVNYLITCLSSNMSVTMAKCDSIPTTFKPLLKCGHVRLHTCSRLSTSARKPEIMGTSMTAMLDEPE